MAEAWANHLRRDQIRAWSAGIEKHGVNKYAIQVMAEVGVDIAGHSSKLVEELETDNFDYVITVCDHAHAACPRFPGTAQVVHHSFDDPPRLAAKAASKDEALAHYRRVRDEIRAFVNNLPASLMEKRQKK